MHKPIFISAFAAVVVLFIFFACQKTQNETTIQPDTSIGLQESATRGGCDLEPSCVLSISQWSSSLGAWDLAVSVETNECDETEIACYRGDNLNMVCQNIGGAAGTFDVIPNATYRLYYTGPVPRTFNIFNNCYLTTVTFTSTSTNPRVLASSAFNCSEKGDCNW